MLNGLGSSTAWAILQRQGDSLQARFSARRDNAAEADRFRARAAEIGSVEELLRDRRSLSMVLEAFQLESEIDKRAVIRKLLTEDPTDPSSFAFRMVDPRYRQFASAFAGRDGKPLGDRALVERIIRDAMVNRFEKAAGEGNPGVREALYFTRRIGEVASVPELMGDRVLTEVARGALGLPVQFGLLSFERQRSLLMQRLDVADFSDPKAVQRMAQRYLLQAGDGSASPSDPVLSLFSGAAGGATGPLGVLGRVSISA